MESVSYQGNLRLNDRHQRPTFEKKKTKKERDWRKQIERDIVHCCNFDWESEDQRELHCLKNSSLDSINSSKQTVCSNSFSYLSICVCWLTTTLARRRRKRSLRIATKLSTPSTTTAVKETFHHHHHHLSYVMVKEIDIDGWGDSERELESKISLILALLVFIYQSSPFVRLLLLSVAIIYNLRCCCHCCRLDRLGFALLRLNRLKKGLFTYLLLLLCCCWRW